MLNRNRCAVLVHTGTHHIHSGWKQEHPKCCRLPSSPHNYCLFTEGQMRSAYASEGWIWPDILNSLLPRGKLMSWQERKGGEREGELVCMTSIKIDWQVKQITYILTFFSRFSRHTKAPVYIFHCLHSVYDFTYPNSYCLHLVLYRWTRSQYY